MVLQVCSHGRKHTIREAIDCIGYGWAQTRVLIVAGFLMTANGAMSYGLIIVNMTLQCEWFLTIQSVGLLDSIVRFGFLLSAIAKGRYLDMYGRRLSMIPYLALATFFQSLSAFSSGFEWMMLLRFLVGFTLPDFLHINTFAVEFLPENDKGKLIYCVSCFSLGSGGAMILGAVILPYISWRYVTLMPAAVGWIAWIMLLRLPESPFYLIASGNLPGAVAVLRRLAKENGTEMPLQIYASSSPAKNRGSFKELFRADIVCQTIVFIAVISITGWLYSALVIVTSENVQEILTNKSVTSEMTVNCRPCHHVSDVQVYNMLSFLLTELASFPVTYYLYQCFGGRLSVMLLALATTVSLPTLLVPTGYIYALQIGLNQLMSNAFMISALNIAPSYFPVHLRGTMAGLIGLSTGISQFLSSVSSRILFIKYPFIFIPFLSACSSLAFTLLIFLPK